MGIILDIRRIVKYLYDVFANLTLWCWAHDPPFGWLGDRFLEIFNHLTDLHYGLYLFAEEYEYLWETIQSAITENTIFRLLQKWLDYAEDAWYWVRHAFENVVDIIDDWWASTQATVKSWISIAVEGLSELLAEWDTFWKVTLPNLVSLEWLGIWWNSRLIDIQSLIDTAIANLGAGFESWLEIKDSVLEFFNDPYLWIYDRLDEFFERFW